MRERWAYFESLPLGGRVDVRAIDGADELNRLFRFDLTLVRPGVMSADGDVAPLLERPGSLWFEEDGAVLGEFHGIVSQAAVEVDVESLFTILRVTLVPRAWLLTQRRGDEIFLGRAAPEIIAEKLARIGLLPERDFVFSLLERYPAREIVAQHDETDWDFVARLAEHAGITTFFEHHDGREVIVFSDSGTTFHPIVRPMLPVRQRRDHPAAFGVKTTLRRTPEATTAHDYNYRTPLVGLLAKRAVAAPGALGEWVEYGPHPKTTDDTAMVARVRAEEAAARKLVVEGAATEMSLRAGGTFVLTGVGPDQELLLTKVAYRFRRPDDEGAAEQAWENHFWAIPAKTPFRPARATPRPRIPGLVNAIVDGAIKGDYAELDEAGRYHLRMLYDRSGRTDLGATHPVRMMQPHAGANYGMHFPLRPGIEVLVGFVNGDPDRPIIVGAAPNPVTQSPVIQQNQTQNVLRTGSNNEIVIEDEHGTERIRIHTPHRNTTVQLGAVEEPEEGALTRTEASISEASRISNNEATTRKTLLSHTATSVLGRSAVAAAGVAAVEQACKRGIDEPANVDLAQVGRDLAWLSAPPEERADKDEPDPGEGSSAGGGEGGGLWSAVGAAVTEMAEQALVALVRAAAHTTDAGLDRAKGRAQGEPLGDPELPGAISAATMTGALVGRDTALVFGDRVAALSSYKTASVMGTEMAQLKSPKAVEIAAGEDAKLTTAGTLDVAAKLVRVVAGYYPEAEAPALDEGTSMGMMARRDLRLTSVEHCIHICAKKNIIANAHTGDMKLKAKKTMSLTAGGITASAGSISARSGGDVEVVADGDIAVSAAGNIQVKAGGDVVVEGATVTIRGGSITLDGPVTVNGDLTVCGAINGG